ncbi:efflux RND transporter periplasmic adaptor subunit [Shewanella gelidii]|nr:efflux RND transporter periplasmic adaptor subunit [Shewanella gelidii]MCL1098123.1 efflux RND transporter periplasmic adaptor subunit [Shewanella gelidii]
MVIYAIAGCKPEIIIETPKEVIVQQVETATIPIYGEYIGVTKASISVEVRARIDGYVEDKLFIEGSAVNAGDTLYQIDSLPYIAAVNRLKAKLESQRVIYEKTIRDVNRLKPLYEKNAASQLDYDNALSAKAEANANLQASLAELEEEQLELSYTEIKAPISGLVGQSEVDIGALVGSKGQSLLTVVKQVDPIFVSFNMSALDYLNIRRNMTAYKERQADIEGKTVEGFVQISLPDSSDYRYWGDISFTDPSVNPETGTFEVRAVLPNPERELLPGQYTNVRIKLNEIENSIVVPQKAIQIEQGGVYVMIVLPNGRVEQRFIVIEHQTEQGVIVKSGLKSGENIIVEGMHRVRHGQLATPLTIEEYRKLEETRNLEISSQVSLQVEE